LVIKIGAPIYELQIWQTEPHLAKSMATRYRRRQFTRIDEIVRPRAFSRATFGMLFDSRDELGDDAQCTAVVSIVLYQFRLLRFVTELSPNFGDGLKDQAAAWA
jgi:hypothetical protein